MPSEMKDLVAETRNLLIGQLIIIIICSLTCRIIVFEITTCTYVGDLIPVVGWKSNAEFTPEKAKLSGKI